MKLVVDKAHWTAGVHQSDDGKMCVVGFFLSACGMLVNGSRVDLILNDPRTAWLVKKYGSHKWDIDYSKEWERLTHLNDYRRLATARDRQEVADILAKHEIKVEFVGFDC